MGRTMLNEYDLPKYFWAEAVNTACYISNRVLIRKHLNKTPFELIYQKPPILSYFKVFGCVCHILNTKYHLEKFQSKSDLGIFLGYSSHSKAYRVFIRRTLIVEESVNVSFNEYILKTPPPLLDDIVEVRKDVEKDRKSVV